MGSALMQPWPSTSRRFKTGNTLQQLIDQVRHQQATRSRATPRLQEEAEDGADGAAEAAEGEGELRQLGVGGA